MYSCLSPSKMRCYRFKDINSYCNRLIQCVQKNELATLEKLVYRYPDLLTKLHTHPLPNENIFTLACNDQHGMENVSEETIEKLIELGANITQPSSTDQWEPIHYAAINCNINKLRPLVKHLSTEQINSLVYCTKHIRQTYPWCKNLKKIKPTYCNNALNILIKYGKRSKDYYECCELLVKSGIIYNRDSNGDFPLDAIPNTEELKTLMQSATKTPELNPIECLKIGDEESFLGKFSDKELLTLDGDIEEQSSCTSLQLCCVKGLTKCAKKLLQCGVDPNSVVTKNLKCPLVLAIKNDHEEIVDLLLEETRVKFPEDILVELLSKYRKIKQFRKIEKYLDRLLDYLAENDKERQRCLFYMDKLNRTALHYATYNKCSGASLQLLKMGASLVSKDVFGHTPLSYINPEVFTQFLDSCIQAPEDDEHFSNMLHSMRVERKKFAIEINFSSFLKKDKDEKNYESSFISQLTKLKNLRPIVNHPSIASFLAMKWAKVRWLVYLNLLFYFISYVCLLLYGFLSETLNMTSNYILVAALIILSSREIYQVYLLRLDYCKRIENYIDISLIGGIIYIIAAGWFTNLRNQNLVAAYSLVFLMSTWGIFVQLRHIPFFAIKVIVLIKITTNFAKYMLIYIFPVLAFFFCFYMLSEDKTDVTFWETLFKTITMFAGDPNADYPSEFTTNPVFAHVVYVMFMILIGIILQNLLIGLAVSDLQDIEVKAKFIAELERAKYITQVDKILTKNYRRSTNQFFSKVLWFVLEYFKVFNHNESILIVEPFNGGRVYIKNHPDVHGHLLLENVQDLFKELIMKDQEVDNKYTFKDIYEKIDQLEKLIHENSTKST